MRRRRPFDDDLVLIAEATTVAFFVNLGWLEAILIGDGRNLPLPRPDVIGIAFVGSARLASASLAWARLAMIVRYAAFLALTIYWALSGGSRGP